MVPNKTNEYVVIWFFFLKNASKAGYQHCNLLVFEGLL